ncbi:MAG: efflux RND transporter periplasmic adaptor subunit, partial [Gallionella sp.]|nr:efflux RND transporter periplasmic adaptor subunit [Gallionella sp.]
VFRLAREGEREVAIAIPESRLASIKVGMPAAIEIGAAGGQMQTFAGRVREINPVADAASRTYAARVAFKSADAAVALGMTARVRLNAADMSKRKGYRVPLTAIFQQGEQAALWVVAADNTISLRRVNVAAYLDEGALISGGIEAGERIVSAGVHKLTAGEQIRPFISGNAQ